MLHDDLSSLHGRHRSSDGSDTIESAAGDVLTIRESGEPARAKHWSSNCCADDLSLGVCVPYNPARTMQCVIGKLSFNTESITLLTSNHNRSMQMTCWSMRNFVKESSVSRLLQSTSHPSYAASSSPISPLATYRSCVKSGRLCLVHVGLTSSACVELFKRVSQPPCLLHAKR